MKKLTKEDIQFIDNYLLKSGVEYMDIRVEMIDHVATAVEIKMETQNECFYDVFKAYMLENKKDLIKQSDYSKKIFKSLLKEVFYYALSLKSLVVFGFAFFVGMVLSYYFNIFSDKGDLKISIITVLFVPFLMTRVANWLLSKERLKRKDKFSATNRMSFIMLVVFYCLDVLTTVLLKLVGDFWILLFLSFVAVFSFNFCLVFNNYINKYKREYAN